MQPISEPVIEENSETANEVAIRETEPPKPWDAALSPETVEETITC